MAILKGAYFVNAESALEESRQEVNEMLGKIIARVDGIPVGFTKLMADMTMAITRLEAAARLAGRIEQAKADAVIVNACTPTARGYVRAQELLSKERDRLRREIEEAKRG